MQYLQASPIFKKTFQDFKKVLFTILFHNTVFAS